MPKGIYDRTKAAAATTQPPANDAAPTRAKKKRKPRAMAVVPGGKHADSAKRFDVSLDLRAGAVTITATNGALTLAADEVLALFAFVRGR